MSATSEKYLQILREQPVLSAPMCGISDFAYRAICREFGGPFAYTQMVAAEGVVRNDCKTLEILDLDETRPEAVIGMQLFGCDAAKLGDSACKLQELGATVVDLNMGCPAKKVVGSLGGAALLRRPDLVEGIFRSMRAALTVPFTVKMRWDWDEHQGAALNIGRMAEAEGVDGLCLHARTREQGYSGRADWDQIRQLKEAVSIPVIGNGDVRTPADAAQMMEQTGCDAVMIGRGVIGDPWLLRGALARVKGQPESEDETLDWESRRDVMMRHARLMVERKGMRRGMIEFRKHASAYLRGQRGVKQMRANLMKIEHPDALEELLRTPLYEMDEVEA